MFTWCIIIVDCVDKSLMRMTTTKALPRWWYMDIYGAHMQTIQWQKRAIIHTNCSLPKDHICEKKKATMCGVDKYEEGDVSELWAKRPSKIWEGLTNRFVWDTCTASRTIRIYNEFSWKSSSWRTVHVRWHIFNRFRGWEKVHFTTQRFITAY